MLRVRARCQCGAQSGPRMLVLYVEDKRAASTKPLAEVHDTIEKKLIQEERQRRQKEWIEKLRKKAYIKMF